MGYQVGAAGIVFFTISFLLVVRWWTDWLGRVLAGTLLATSMVLSLTTLRQFHPEWGHSYYVCRLIVFWVFGLAVWSSLVTFVWAQFFAPRLKGTRLKRVPHDEGKYRNEEAALADSRHNRDGDLHDRTGGHD